MTPYLDDGDVQLYHGDVLTVLRSLPAGVAQTCVTSPPYWGLRDYGTGEWTGGDTDCDHTRKTLHGQHADRPRGWDGSFRNTGVPQPVAYGVECGRCGARRVDSQLGLEASPDEYVERLVAVFREVWRVLRDDGTVWLNLGDSYASGNTIADPEVRARTSTLGPKRDGLPGNSAHVAGGGTSRRPPPGLKPKDLVGIPWRVAFALQADGWYLRSDIVWSKPNPMPESVTDRPTKSHEYLFLLAKQPRYFYDADAIREPVAVESILREGRARDAAYDVPGQTPQRRPYASGNVERKVGDERGRPGSHIGGSVPWTDDGTGRNRRSVWTITVEPFPEAHFATYPQALVRPCVLAGSRPGDVVLDPFIGSGTTALVARNHGRRAIGIDLSAEYLRIAAKRLRQLSLLSEPES